MSKKKLFLLLTTLSVTALSAVTAHAGSVSANSTVTINFTGACSISATNPSITYAGEDSSSNASVTVNCSNGLPWTLTADGGLNADGELRRGKKDLEYLTYRLFKDAGLTQEVGVTTGTVATGSGTGLNQTTTAYFVVKAADNQSIPTVGDYPDTLGWNLTF